MRMQSYRRFYSSVANNLPGKQAYILSGARTAIGRFNGGLKSVSAVELGTITVKEAIARSGVEKSHVGEVYFGQVLQGSVGQAPARQVGLKAGLPVETEATTINKVCASGLKAVSLAAQSIQLGNHDVIVAGGMESMSQSPFYLPRNSATFGPFKVQDSIILDGLTDVYDQIHMGMCCENTNKRYGFTREMQDEFAIESYKRAQQAITSGAFKAEIVPVEIKSRKGTTTIFDQDEEPHSLKMDKLSTLRPAFDPKGTVTAANSSSLNDGAAALIIGSADAAKKANVVAKIIAYYDAATNPIDFTIAPSIAIPKLIERAGLSIKDISKFEINEAFAGVSLANNKLLNLDPLKVNVNGGAVALGHPIGASGARILVSLLYQLKQGEFGLAAICNGGGGASSIIIQKVDSVE